jgi:hypothetical protein
MRQFTSLLESRDARERGRQRRARKGTKMRSLVLASRLCLAPLALHLSTLVAKAQTSLPGDVSTEFPCAVDISGWYANGIVKTPDNSIFNPSSSCSFYQAAAQMFIWLTSPPPPDYGGGGYVFTSPIFNALSRRVDGKRDLIPRDAYASSDFFDATLSQTGPNGSAVVFDNNGKMHELTYPKWVQNGSGAMMEIMRAQIRPRNSPLFFNLNNRPIEWNSRSKVFDRNMTEIIPGGKTIIVNGVRYQTDRRDNVIDYGPGQAGTGKVLMTQNGKLVFYAVLVNDVFVSFHAANYKPNQPVPRLPTTRKEVDELGRAFPDADALVVEVKTAWIEVGDDEREEYLTIHAKIPDYDKSEYVWTPKSTPKHAMLALVGMHIAFTAKHQERMLWATFENINNTRNLSYEYFGKGGLTTSRPADIGGAWLFSSSDDTSINESRMHIEGNKIVGDKMSNNRMKQIGPSNVRRVHPWGSDPDSKRDNTDLININESIHRQLSDRNERDVRRNYIMIGTTWGAADQGPRKLANSTMETFKPDSNCLGCHGERMLSHVWNELVPTRR